MQVHTSGIIDSSGSSPDALVDAFAAVNPVLVAPTVVKQLVSLLIKRRSYYGGAGASLALIHGERGEESQRVFLIF